MSINQPHVSAVDSLEGSIWLKLAHGAKDLSELFNLYFLLCREYEHVF